MFASTAHDLWSERLWVSVYRVREWVQTHRITVELNYSVRAPVFRVLGNGTNDWVHFALCWLTLTEWFYFSHFCLIFMFFWTFYCHFSTSISSNRAGDLLRRSYWPWGIEVEHYETPTVKNEVFDRTIDLCDLVIEWCLQTGCAFSINHVHYSATIILICSEMIVCST